MAGAVAGAFRDLFVAHVKAGEWVTASTLAGRLGRDTADVSRRLSNLNRSGDISRRGVAGAYEYAFQPPRLKINNGDWLGPLLQVHGSRLK